MYREWPLRHSIHPRLHPLLSRPPPPPLPAPPLLPPPHRPTPPPLPQRRMQRMIANRNLIPKQRTNRRMANLLINPLRHPSSTFSLCTQNCDISIYRIIELRN